MWLRMWLRRPFRQRPGFLLRRLLPALRKLLPTGLLPALRRLLRRSVPWLPAGLRHVLQARLR
jgi:hypothetical protein